MRLRRWEKISFNLGSISKLTIEKYIIESRVIILFSEFKVMGNIQENTDSINSAFE